VRTDVLGVIDQPASAAQGEAGLLVRDTVSRTPTALLGIAAGGVQLEVNGGVLGEVQHVTLAIKLRGEGGAMHAVWRDGLGRRRVGTWRP